MVGRKHVVLCFMSLLLCLGAVGTSVAQGIKTGEGDTELGPTAFVMGFNRITVYQTQIVGDGSDYSLPSVASAGEEWVVSILDITNFGTAPQTLTLADFQWIPVEGGDPVTSNVSQGPSAQLGFADVQSNGSATVPVDSTIRVAIAFSIPTEDATQFAPVVMLGDEQVNATSTIVDKLDVTALSPVQPWSGSQGVVQTVPGNGTIEVSIGGTVQVVSLAGVVTPPTDKCFGAESSAAVVSLSGGSVWVEDDPTSEDSLVWYWDASRGHLALLNQSLVEQGFGAYNDGSDTAYATWLAADTEAAETDEVGLWSVCKGAGGEWINPPTPAPAPTKTADEVRAEYTWPDIRDVVIRPQQFEGEKIAFQGEVFNIPPGQDASVFEFQVYVTSPTGDLEAVYVYFEGDATGIYEGTYVTVYGEGAGYVTGTNAYGGEITQPLVRADIIDR
jgi:endonuclease YncB( thermonuclease family)